MSEKDKSIHVKLIDNPSAGIASDAADNLKLVVGYLKKNGLKADVARAKPKAKATPLARQAIKDGYKIVIAMGGDGTVEAVMRGMIGSKVRLGIIPAGIENNIAKSLGIPEDMIEACALIASDTTRKLGVGQVKIGKGKWFYFFEMASIGLSNSLYPDGNKASGEDLSGPHNAAEIPVQPESMPKVFLNLDDERIIAVESMLVVVSNTPAFGKKFLVTPDASLQEGLLDISVFQGFGKDDLDGYYASMLDGGYTGKGRVRRYQAHKLKVKSSPKLKVMADGIELGKGTATIRMRPGVLRVIAARKSQGLNSPAKSKGIPVQPQDKVNPVPARGKVEKISVPISSIMARSEEKN